MGCDGGTIPKRNEVVKNKQQGTSRDKNADLSAQWQFCSLSGLPLKRPIVACQLGRLYNKEAIIEHLLRLKSSNKTSQRTDFSHIKSLKDVQELKLKERNDYEKTHQASSGSEQFRAQFVCPISGLELNGKYKFFFILNCGCVLSERALKEVPNNNQCLLCHKLYDTKNDLIVLNGDGEEVKLLKENLIARRKSRASLKRTHDGQLKNDQ